ncbi:hypothetical protein U062_01933 [Gammaproteobacteria bacterium MOLA455]|nr:hypothetical protein U062_01933 [Gammaproteobacteria bacterium MOLA455]
MTDQNTSEQQTSKKQTEEQELIARLNSETAKIAWHDLQIHYAAGNVLGTAAHADLIKVAIEFNRDNATQIQQWLADSSLFEISDQQATEWYEKNQELWALVIPPFVLVQQVAD